MELEQIVRDIAAGMEAADRRRPQASSSSTAGRFYQPGVGPFRETEAIALTLAELLTVRGGVYAHAGKRCYPGMQQAMAELRDAAVGLADSNPALLTTKRESAGVVAVISPVMRAGPIWLPNGLGVAPGARRAASQGGAQPANPQRPPWPYRRHPHHRLVPALLEPLPAGGRT
jgi:hypothetical protein